MPGYALILAFPQKFIELLIKKTIEPCGKSLG